VVAIVAISAAGCFKSPDKSKLSCTTSAHCPGGYTCVVPQPGLPGTCEKAIDGGSVDSAAYHDVALGIDGPGAGETLSPVDSSSSIDFGSLVDSSTVLDLALDSLMNSGPEAAPDASPDRAPDMLTDSPIISTDVAPPVLDVGTDQPSGKPRGSTCSVGTECAEGFCTDGYCCDTACIGTCQACDVATAVGSARRSGQGLPPTRATALA